MMKCRVADIFCMRQSLLISAFLCLGMFYGPIAHAQILSSEDVLYSSAKHFPAILQARESVAIAKGKLLESEGAFDATLEQNFYARPSGFYEGRQSDTRLVKPLKDYNARVYGGYRVAEGNFPIYEDARITNEDGEYLFGAQLSLLRNSLIDENRARLYNAEIDTEIQEIELLLSQVGVQHDALLYYWEWVAASHARDVYAFLLETAESRQSSFRKKLERGDIARIFLTENEQNILRRKAQLISANQALEIAANRLSLFYRDDAGNPVSLIGATPPERFPTADTIIALEDSLATLEERPELQRIKRRHRQLENSRLLGENALLPKTDLSVEYSNDLGAGESARGTAESVVKLDISIPLQRRFGEGKVKRAEAEIRQLEHKRRLTQNQLTIELRNTLARLQNAKDTVQVTASRIKAAITMQQAERQRFDDGNSDFFLLNMREERRAEAEIDHILAQLSYQKALADTYSLTLNTDELKL